MILWNYWFLENVYWFGLTQIWSIFLFILEGLQNRKIEMGQLQKSSEEQRIVFNLSTLT